MAGCEHGQSVVAGDGRAGAQGKLAAGQAGHDGAGGTPTGGVGVNASPLSPPLAIFAFRQPH